MRPDEVVGSPLPSFPLRLPQGLGLRPVRVLPGHGRGDVQGHVPQDGAGMQGERGLQGGQVLPQGQAWPHTGAEEVPQGEGRKMQAFLEGQ